MKKIFFFMMVMLLFAVPAFAANVSLTWDPPTTNEDGTPLTDLAGYKVYYGNASGNYTENIDVVNVLTYTVKNLTDGTWYFAVTAYDTSDNESDYSNEVNKTITVAPAAPVLRTVEIVAVIRDGKLVDLYVRNIDDN